MLRSEITSTKRKNRVHLAWPNVSQILEKGVGRRIWRQRDLPHSSQSMACKHSARLSGHHVAARKEPDSYLGPKVQEKGHLGLWERERKHERATVWWLRLLIKSQLNYSPE